MVTCATGKCFHAAAPALGLGFSPFMCLCLAKTPVARSMTGEQATPWVTGMPRDLVLWLCLGAAEWFCTGVTSSCASRLAQASKLLALRETSAEVLHACRPRCRSSVLPKWGAGSLNLCREKKCCICPLATSSLLCSFC